MEGGRGSGEKRRENRRKERKEKLMKEGESVPQKKISQM